MLIPSRSTAVAALRPFAIAGLTGCFDPAGDSRVDAASSTGDQEVPDTSASTFVMEASTTGDPGVRPGSTTSEIVEPTSTTATTDDDHTSESSSTWDELKESSSTSDVARTSGGLHNDETTGALPEGSSSGEDGPPIDEVCQSPLAMDMIDVSGGSFVDDGSGPNTTHIISSFRMGRTEVTVSDYERCLVAEVCPAPGAAPTFGANFGVAGRGEHPINAVSWDGARAFCGWVCGRLPTEWEWEWAARGRAAARTYPWGNVPAPSCSYVVMNEPGLGLGCGLGSTDEVGSRSPDGDSFDGIADLAGNVSEWTSTVEADEVVVRGSSWYFTDEPHEVRERWTSAPNASLAWSIGFRCVWDE